MGHFPYLKLPEAAILQEYHDHKASGRLVPDGTNVRWLSSRGPLWRLIGRENA